jgi:hypothetical protein
MVVESAIVAMLFIWNGRRFFSAKAIGRLVTVGKSAFNQAEKASRRR